MRRWSSSIPPCPSPLAAQSLDIPVFGMEFTFDTTRAAFNLAYTGTLERFPNITWVMAHAGGTVPYLVGRFSLLWMVDHDLAERAPLGAAAYMANLYYDTALSANPHVLSSLAELVGWDHVVFGSDFPFAPELARAAVRREPGNRRAFRRRCTRWDQGTTRCGCSAPTINPDLAHPTARRRSRLRRRTRLRPWGWRRSEGLEGTTAQHDALLFVGHRLEEGSRFVARRLTRHAAGDRHQHVHCERWSLSITASA